MNIIIVMALLLVLATVGMGIYGINNEVKGKKATRFLGINLSTFFLLVIASTIVLFSGTTAQAADVAVVGPNIEGMRYLAAALSTGLACIGSGIAVSVSGSAAIGAISENEKILGKTIIFVGLAEGIAIYGMIISIMILNQ